MKFKLFIGKFLFLLVILVGSMTSLYSQKPMGKIVDIGTAKLHLNCTGEGSPTVILESGAGAWSIHWSEVQKELAKTNRVCSYDRAGLGWSSEGTMPRTAERATFELNQLLTKSKEKAPFILVGHSFGGYIARIFNYSFPEKLAGIGLIDSAHENQWKELPVAEQMLQFGLQDLKKRFEKLNVGEIKRKEFLSHLPDNLLLFYQTALTNKKTQKAVLSEMENAVISAEQTSKTKKLGKMPLLVLSAGNSFASFIPDDEKNKSLLENLNNGWMKMQGDLALLSTNSEHLISRRAKHTITKDNPKLVSYSIKLLTEMVKSSKKSE